MFRKILSRAFSVFIPAALALSLAACGGAGGGDSGAGGGGDTSYYSYRYEALPHATTNADFLSQLNTQGARGYRFLAALSLTPGQSTAHGVYVKDGNSSYDYKMLEPQNTASGLLTQMNAEGANGYRYLGDYIVEFEGGDPLKPKTRTLYVRDASQTARYNYELVTTGRAATDNEFLTQVNAQGAKGYWLVGGLTLGNLYMKDQSQPGARYTYRLQPYATTRDLFLAQANVQGREGYRFKGGLVLASGVDLKTIYFKDTSQNASFSYSSEQLSSGPAFVERANNLGSSGIAYLTSNFFSSDNLSLEIYFKPSNCTGFMCTVLHPIIQN